MKCYECLFLTADTFEKYTIACEGCISEEERFQMIEAYVTINGLIDVETVEDGTESVDDNADTDRGVNVENKTDEDHDNKPGSLLTVFSVENEAAVALLNKKRLQSSAGDHKDIKLKNLHLKYVRRLLDYIHFENMTKTSFYNVVCKSPLLTDKEKFQKMFLTK